MPTSDIPFMVEGSEKFPAEGEDWVMRLVFTIRRGRINSHKKAAQGVPQLGDRHCQRRT
jgi:hypothetical protein